MGFSDTHLQVSRCTSASIEMQELSHFLMRRGRPIKPHITLDSVNAALKSLDYSSQVQSEPQLLENLLLVDFRLQNSARPSTENVRFWMLQKILVEFIINTLNQHRHYFSLPPAKLNSA